MTFVDIHKIVTSYNDKLSRSELVLFAAYLSRDKKITHVEALRLIENHEYPLDELRERVVESLQTVKPPEPDDEDKITES
tara:strand:+ start:34 stop:273 length:240 start_codon:yes stop_codon:yes gene_type:complete